MLLCIQSYAARSSSMVLIYSTSALGVQNDLKSHCISGPLGVSTTVRTLEYITPRIYSYVEGYDRLRAVHD